MTKRESDRDYARARREIDKAAAAIMRVIEGLLGRTVERVPREHVVEMLFLTLLRDHDLVQLLDRMAQPGPVTLQLSNALHDYRDAPWEDH